MRRGKVGVNVPVWVRYDRGNAGLVDNFVSPQGPEIGECIYCGERSAPLGTEHAIPYGLNGPWTLLRASCEACAKITSRFEHDAMRRLWPDVRTVLSMQSRRRDKRSTTLPLEVQRAGVRETVQVRRSKFPTYLTTPLFPPPAVFWTNQPVRGVFTNLAVMHLCGPTFAEASKEYPGADFVGMHINFSAEDFARMLAKIGFCAAVAIVGLGAFSNTPIRQVNRAMEEQVALGINRHFVGQFAKFEHVRHLITGRENLAGEMAWAHYTLQKDGQRTMKFRRQ